MFFLNFLVAKRDTDDNLAKGLWTIVSQQIGLTNMNNLARDGDYKGVCKPEIFFDPEHR